MHRKPVEMAEKRTKSDGFMLRFPDGMRDRVKAAAEASGRSMNAEIVERLEESFTFPQKEYRLRAEISEMNQQIESLHQEIVDLTDEINRRQKREIDHLAELRRLRIDRQQFDQEMEKKRAEIDALRSELGEANQILRNYVAHSESLQRVEEQLRLLSERLPGPEKDGA